MKTLMKLFVILTVFGSVSWSLAWAGEGAEEEFNMVNLRQPMENLTTGGQPSEGDIRTFAERGYELVINLRLVGEFSEFNEAEVVEAYGMRYLNIPVTGMEDLTPENARMLHEALEAAGGPVVLHCASGRRAGALLGIEGFLFHGLSEKQAIELGVRANLGHVAGAIEDSIEKYSRE
jgi:uncharacterized protein (TIGR01244 family)